MFFCLFEKAHNDYVYQQAWIDKMSRQLYAPDRFQEVTQKTPKN